MNWAKAANIAGVAGAIVAVLGFLIGLLAPNTPAGRVVNSIIGGIIIADDITVQGGNGGAGKMAE